MFFALVRYLSFLGISLDNVKRCGFIVQVDERQFVAHCFHVEPSAGALCKTIEAACKLRYQKCLDAHAKQQQQQQQHQQNGQYDYTAARTAGSNAAQSSSPVSVIRTKISGVFSKIMSK